MLYPQGIPIIAPNMSGPHNHPLREYLNLRLYVSSEFPYPSASHRRRTRLRPELPSSCETRERAILEPLPSLEIDEEQANIELCDINEEHGIEDICPSFHVAYGSVIPSPRRRHRSELPPLPKSYRNLALHHSRP